MAVAALVIALLALFLVLRLGASYGRTVRNLKVHLSVLYKRTGGVAARPQDRHGMK